MTLALALLGCATEVLPPLCDDAPVVTWGNFGAGFVLERCAGCHAATAPNRYGAPEGVTFDTVDEVWSHRDAVLRTVVDDPPSMPPSTALTEDERLLVELWLTCAAPGT